MDQWTPDEVDAHVQFMRDFAARLEETGEFVDTQALALDGAFVPYGGEGRTAQHATAQLSGCRQAFTAPIGTHLRAVASWLHGLGGQSHHRWMNQFLGRSRLTSANRDNPAFD